MRQGNFLKLLYYCLLCGFCGGSAFFGNLNTFLDGGACRLDKNDDYKDKTLEGILNINAQSRNGDNDEVDSGIGQRAENNAKHIALAACHIDARQNNGRNGIHLIADAGRSRSYITYLARLKDACNADRKTGENEHGDLDPSHVDTGKAGALFIGADRVNAFAVLGILRNNDEEDRHCKKDKGNIRYLERTYRKLADAELHSEKLVIAVVGDHCKLRGGGAGDRLIYLSDKGKRQRTVYEHGAEGNDKRRHFPEAHKHTVDKTAQRAGCKSRKNCQQDGVCEVKDNNGNAGAEDERRTDGKVDLSGYDDKRHAEGDRTDDTGILAAQNGNDMAPLKGVAARPYGIRIAYHYDKQNKDIAVC